MYKATFHKKWFYRMFSHKQKFQKDHFTNSLIPVYIFLPRLKFSIQVLRLSNTDKCFILLGAWHRFHMGRAEHHLFYWRWTTRKKKKCCFFWSNNNILTLERKLVTANSQEAFLEYKTVGRWVELRLMENSHPFYSNRILDITFSLPFNDHLENYPCTSDKRCYLWSNNFYCLQWNI